MVLNFSNKAEDYSSFSFPKGVTNKTLEDHFKIPEANTMAELKEVINLRSKAILERFNVMNEVKSSFVIDDILKVDFGNEPAYRLKLIINEFLNKGKFKKYKNLLLWVPLLQDHFWLNEGEHDRKIKPPSKFYSGGRRKSRIEELADNPPKSGSWYANLNKEGQAVVDKYAKRPNAKPAQVSFKVTTADLIGLNYQSIPVVPSQYTATSYDTTGLRIENSNYIKEYYNQLTNISKQLSTEEASGTSDPLPW